MHPHGSFVWIDLSTFELSKAKAFYSKCLGWNLSNSGDGYYIVSDPSHQSAAGIYEMPAFFQKIKMPSFWMTYIAVDDIQATVAKAQALGAKVELEESNALGKVALIRDPLGAGFTCYQGTQASARETDSSSGRWVGSELFISDLQRIQSFYTELFDWEIEAIDENKRCTILTKEGQQIGAINVATNAEKGDKEYWAVIFQVNDLGQTTSAIQNAGGEIHQQSGNRVYAYDNQGAYFIVQDGVERTETIAAKPTSLKWRSMLALALVYIAVLFELNWAWSLLFMIWVIPDLKRGQTYFLEPISRSENPILYWLILGTWISLSVLMLFLS